MIRVLFALIPAVSVPVQARRRGNRHPPLALRPMSCRTTRADLTLGVMPGSFAVCRCFGAP